MRRQGAAKGNVRVIVSKALVDGLPRGREVQRVRLMRVLVDEVHFKVLVKAIHTRTIEGDDELILHDARDRLHGSPSVKAVAVREVERSNGRVELCVGEEGNSRFSAARRGTRDFMDATHSEIDNDVLINRLWGAEGRDAETLA